VCSLIYEGQICTTVVKAKETRRLAEKMVTLGKKGDLHRRRLAISKLRDKDAVAALFSEIAPRYASRDGGYTRIIRLDSRRGDGAEMCILQWVEEEISPKKSSGKKAKAEKKDDKKTDTESDKASAAGKSEEAETSQKAENKKADDVKDEKKPEKAESGKEEKESEESGKGETASAEEKNAEKEK
jgi:large subunit ribosomal protein L17